MKEVDSHPSRQLSLTMEREEWIVHRVGILACNAWRRVVRVERAAITVRGDPQFRIVLQGPERSPLPRVWSQEFLAKSLQCESQCGTCDGAVSGDHHTSRLQPGLGCSIRSRASLRCLDIDGPVNSVEFH